MIETHSFPIDSSSLHCWIVLDTFHHKGDANHVGHRRPRHPQVPVRSKARRAIAAVAILAAAILSIAPAAAQSADDAARLQARKFMTSCAEYTGRPLIGCEIIHHDFENDYVKAYQADSQSIFKMWVFLSPYRLNGAPADPVATIRQDQEEACFWLSFGNQTHAIPEDRRQTHRLLLRDCMTLDNGMLVSIAHRTAAAVRALTPGRP